MAVTWWRAGLLGHCPSCGEGPLFAGLLRFHDQCPACGNSFADADVGDGATVFVVLAAGALVVPLVPLLLLALKIPVWVVLPVLGALATGLVLSLLRLFRSLLFVLQRRHRAGEGQLVRPATEPNRDA